MARKAPKLRTYRVTFRRSDIHWPFRYIRNVQETFTATDDANARVKVSDYIRINRPGAVSVTVKEFIEVVHPEVTRKVRLTRTARLGRITTAA